MLDSEIIELYKTHSTRAITKLTGLGFHRIKQILTTNGIKMRQVGFKRKVFFNENFFEKIDTEAKAYFLGYLYADGCVHSNTNRITLALSEKDKPILEKFMEVINYTGRLYEQAENSSIILGREVKRRKFFSLSLTSKKIHTDLIKLGCRPRKTTDLSFPASNIVPDIMMPHFLRGFLDGDGWIVGTKNKKSSETHKKFDMGFISDIKFLTGFKEYVNKKYGIEGTIKNRPANETSQIKLLIYNGWNKMLPILKSFYDEATIFLQRKKDKYLEMLHYLDDRKDTYKSYLDKVSKIVIQKDLNGNIIKEFSSIRKAALEVYGNVNFSPNIRLCLKTPNRQYKGFMWEAKII